MTLRQVPRQDETCVVKVKFYWLRDSTQQLYLAHIVVPLCIEELPESGDQAVAAETENHQASSEDAQRLQATVIQSCKEIYYHPPPFPKAEENSAENSGSEDEYIGQRLDVWQNNGHNFWAGDTEHECKLTTIRSLLTNCLLAFVYSTALCSPFLQSMHRI